MDVHNETSTCTSLPLSLPPYRRFTRALREVDEGGKNQVNEPLFVYLSSGFPSRRMNEYIASTLCAADPFPSPPPPSLPLSSISRARMQEARASRVVRNARAKYNVETVCRVCLLSYLCVRESLQ